MKWLIEERYSSATKVRIVLDNLNTHFEKSFYETFTAQETKKLLKKIRFECQKCVKVERAEPTTKWNNTIKIGLPQTYSGVVCKLPYAAEKGNFFGGEPCLPAGRDKEKRPAASAGCKCVLLS